MFALTAALEGSTQTATDTLSFEIRGSDRQWQPVTNSVQVENRVDAQIIPPVGFFDIYYTLDGTAPSLMSERSSLVTITNTATLRAIAYNPDYSASVSGQLFVEVIPRVYLTFAGLPATNLVSVSPPGEKFPPGTAITLTAEDRDGWVFEHWTNALAQAGTNRSASLVMDADKTIGARYVTRVNTAVTAGSGQIEVFPQGGGFGETITVKATPSAGYYFAAWETPPGGSNYIAQFPITTGTQLVAAAFAPLSPDQVTLTITSSGFFPQQLIIPPAWATPNKNVYSRGETVSVTSYAGWNIRFNGWSGDASGRDNPFTLTLDSSKTVQANFEPVSRHTKRVDPTFGGHYHAPAITDDGTVYVALRTTLLSLTRDLQTNWALATGLRYHSIPAIGNSGTIYLAGANGDAVAVRPDGTVLWTFNSGNPHPYYAQPPEATLRPRPVVLSPDETLYIAPLDLTNVYVLKNGALVRTIAPIPEAPTEKRMPIIGADGTLYIAASGGFSAHTPDGAEKWRAPYPRPSAIDSDGRLYSLQGTNIIALDFNGNHLWTASLSAPVEEALLGEGGRIFARSSLGLAALQTNGSLLWTNGTVGRFAPLADGGALVVHGVDKSGNLYEYYQNITAEGRNGPLLAVQVGFSYTSLVYGEIPVVSKSGDAYVGWSSSHSEWMSYVSDDVPLARSSWPLPWGFNNTGTAVKLPPKPRLSILRNGSNLTLQGSDFESGTLETSSNLREWIPLEHFATGFTKEVPADGQQYFRVRQD